MKTQNITVTKYEKYLKDPARLEDAIKESETAERLLKGVLLLAAIFVIYRWLAYDDGRGEQEVVLNTFHIVTINILIISYIWAKLRLHLLACLYAQYLRSLDLQGGAKNVAEQVVAIDR